MKIVQNMQDPYSALIARFVEQTFPTRSTQGGELLELVFAEVMGTKQNRFGPKPGPESQVAFRDVLRCALARGTPVPIVSPWGSEKPDGSSVDIAEIGALKSLECLHKRVSAHYAPGIDVSLRIEDLSAPFQFYDRADQARAQAQAYTAALTRLISVLGLGGFITARPDSGYGHTEEEFNQLASSILPAVEQHLSDIRDPARFADLKALGWDQPVADATVMHYMHGYAKLYPDRDIATKLHILARYFAGGLARKIMGHNGALKRWDGRKFVELYFGQTPPGLEPSRYLRRIHYRTLPMEYTSNHMAPWRAKGYVEVSEDGDVCPKLGTFFAPPTGLTPHTLRLSHDMLSVDVRSDYVLV